MPLPEIAPIFATLQSVVVARFGRDGSLLGGNAGFTRLCPDTMAFGWRYALLPSAAELAQRQPDDQGRVHRGLVTLGDAMGEMRTLAGEAWFDGDTVLLVAGYDLDEFDRITASMLDLNNALDAAHRELIQAHRELAQREETIRKLSLTDALTGIGNRRHLDETLAAECERARRYGQPLAVVMLDLDHFKRINDAHGHETGDLVLRETGALLRAFVRQSDTAARLGGEEFIVLMPSTPLADAHAAALRLHAAIEAHAFGPLPAVTASLGVAAYVDADTPAQLLARVDAATYRAKASGRNRVVAAASG